MSKIAETGHAKNVANFKNLTAQLTEMGARYNPASDRISLKALIKRCAVADQVKAMLTKIGSQTDISTNERVTQFAQIAKLITRVNATLKMARVTPETMDDAAGFIAKLRGSRRGKSAEVILDDASAVSTGEASNRSKTISVSQRSFDMQEEAFSQLASLIAAQPAYKSNDSELTKVSINNFLEALRAANAKTIQANAAYNEALLVRNTELYDPQNGLISIVGEVKEYLKSLPGGYNSQDFKNAVKLNFTIPH